MGLLAFAWPRINHDSCLGWYFQDHVVRPILTFFFCFESQTPAFHTQTPHIFSGFHTSTISIQLQIIQVNQCDQIWNFSFCNFVPDPTPSTLKFPYPHLTPHKNIFDKPPYAMRCELQTKESPRVGPPSRLHYSIKSVYPTNRF